MITKRQSHSRHTYLYVVSLLVLLGGFYVMYALLRPLPLIQPQTVALPKGEVRSLPFVWPSNSAAAIGISDWGVLASSDDTPRPTASTIKLLTALAVLQARPFSSSSQGATLTLNTTDVEFYRDEQARGGSTIPVEVGETITERQALEALLLPSANNIATTLGVWAYGSMSAYLAAANQLARFLDLQSTHVADASGFSPLTTSTPHDLVKLGIASIKNAVVASIMAEKHASLPVVGMVDNVNILLGMQDVIGGKTGNTPEAGGCFIGINRFQKDDHSLIVVSAVMAASSLVQALDISSLFVISAEQNIVSRPVLVRGELVATYTVPWSTFEFHAEVTHDVVPLYWGSRPVHSSVRRASVVVGQKAAGDVTVTVYGKQYTSTLALDHPIPPPSLIWRLTHVI